MKRLQTGKKSAWQKTKVSNLVRYTQSRIYFARIRVRGKLIRKSLKTTVFSVAQLKLADFAKEQRSVAEMQGTVTGKMTFGDALAIYEKALTENTRRSFWPTIHNPMLCRGPLRSCAEKVACRLPVYSTDFSSLK